MRSRTSADCIIATPARADLRAHSPCDALDRGRAAPQPRARPVFERLEGPVAPRDCLHVHRNSTSRLTIDVRTSFREGQQVFGVDRIYGSARPSTPPLLLLDSMRGLLLLAGFVLLWAVLSVIGGAPNPAPRAQNVRNLEVHRDEGPVRADPRGTPAWDLGSDLASTDALPPREPRLGSSLQVTLGSTGALPIHVSDGSLYLTRDGNPSLVAPKMEQSSRDTWRIVGLAAGDYVLHVFDANHLPYSRTVSLSPNGELSLRLQLEPGLQVRGTVTDTSGRPLPGMLVTFSYSANFAEDDLVERAAITGDGGRFAIRGLMDHAGSLLVTEATSPPGSSRSRWTRQYLPTRLKFLRPGEGALRVLAQRAPRVTFRTQPDVRTLRLLSPRSLRHSLRRARDGLGFELRGAPIGRPLSISLRGPGVAVTQIEILPLDEGEARDIGTVRLNIGVTVRGTVVNASSQPIAGAKVWAVADCTSDEVTTNERGEFALEHVAGRVAEVWARSPHHLSGFVSVADTDRHRPVVIRLATGGVLRGAIQLTSREQGKRDARSVEVHAHDPASPDSSIRVWLDQNGRFQQRLPAGDYLLIVSKRVENSKPCPVHSTTFKIDHGAETRLDIEIR